MTCDIVSRFEFKLYLTAISSPAAAEHKAEPREVYVCNVLALWMGELALREGAAKFERWAGENRTNRSVEIFHADAYVRGARVENRLAAQPITVETLFGGTDVHCMFLWTMFV